MATVSHRTTENKLRLSVYVCKPGGWWWLVESTERVLFRQNSVNAFKLNSWFPFSSRKIALREIFFQKCHFKLAPLEVQKSKEGKGGSVASLQLYSNYPRRSLNVFKRKKYIYFQTILPLPYSDLNCPFRSQMSPHPEVSLESRLNKWLHMEIKVDMESRMPTFQLLSWSSKCITVGVCITLQISFYRHIIATNSLQTAICLLGSGNNVHNRSSTHTGEK